MKKTTLASKNGIMGLFLIGLLFFSSCLNNKENDFSVETDVISFKKTIDGEVKYATAFYAYGSERIDSASVTLPGGDTLHLKSASGGYTFMREPEETGYTTTLPVQGNYLFKITSKKGEELTSNDQQGFANIGFVVPDTIQYDANKTYLYLKWTQVSGADNYVVNLHELEGDVVFGGYVMEGNVTKYYISNIYNTGKWYKTPVQGETYRLTIQASKNDAGATSENSPYNIQEISISEFTITWEPGSN